MIDMTNFDFAVIKEYCPLRDAKYYIDKDGNERVSAEDCKAQPEFSGIGVFLGHECCEQAMCPLNHLLMVISRMPEK